MTIICLLLTKSCGDSLLFKRRRVESPVRNLIDRMQLEDSTLCKNLILFANFIHGTVIFVVY